MTMKLTGRAHGFGAPRHVRLSYAADRAVLEEGITRIPDALARLG